MNRTFCFVPVRKGSRGIPGKNLRMLGDKPLVCWIIDTILASGIADEVCVATNCDEMESLIRRRYKGVVRIFRRSEWSARDEAPSLEVVQEFFYFCKPERNDDFILLQATSPFTTAQELRGLAEEMKRGEADSYVACCRLKKFRWSDEGRPLDYSFETKPRRQEYKGFLIESGAFYASTVGRILDSGQLLSGVVKVVEVGPAGMIDIDEEADWRQAEHYIETGL